MIEMTFGTLRRDMRSIRGFTNAKMKSASATGSVTSLAAFMTKRNRTTAAKTRQFLICLLYCCALFTSFIQYSE